MVLIIWFIVWLVQGLPHIAFPDSSWAISLYVCAAVSILIPHKFYGIK